MRTLEYLKSLTELFKKEDIVNIRDYHIERLIRFEDCNLHLLCFWNARHSKQWLALKVVQFLLH